MRRPFTAKGQLALPSEDDPELRGVSVGESDIGRIGATERGSPISSRQGGTRRPRFNPHKGGSPHLRHSSPARFRAFGRAPFLGSSIEPPLKEARNAERQRRSHHRQPDPRSAAADDRRRNEGLQPPRRGERPPQKRKRRVRRQAQLLQRQRLGCPGRALRPVPLQGSPGRGRRPARLEGAGRRRRPPRVRRRSSPTPSSSSAANRRTGTPRAASPRPSRSRMAVARTTSPSSQLSRAGASTARWAPFFVPSSRAATKKSRPRGGGGTLFAAVDLPPLHRPISAPGEAR